MNEFIYSYSLTLSRKIKVKSENYIYNLKQWNCRWEKMSKAIVENKLTVTIKRFFWEFSL